MPGTKPRHIRARQGYEGYVLEPAKRPIVINEESTIEFDYARGVIASVLRFTLVNEPNSDDSVSGSGV